MTIFSDEGELGTIVKSRGTYSEYSYYPQRYSINFSKLAVTNLTNVVIRFAASFYFEGSASYNRYSNITVALNQTSVNLVKDQFLLYVNDENYLEWTPESFSIKGAELSVGEAFLGNTVIRGDLQVLGNTVITGAVFGHPSVSAASSSTILEGGSVFSDINFDGYGHVTSWRTRELTTSDIGAAEASITITSSNGIAGGGDLTTNRSFALTGQALALHTATGIGFITRTGADTVHTVSINGTTDQIYVSNSDGAGGDVVLSLPQSIHSEAVPAFAGLSLGGVTSIVSDISGQDIFTVDGVNGRLFTVTDDLSDVIFSANTISGIPVIEAFSDYRVSLVNGNALFASSGSLTIPSLYLSSGNSQGLILGGLTKIYENSGLNIDSGSPDRGIVFKINGSEKLSITTEGKVGIGAANTGSKQLLVVNGLQTQTIYQPSTSPDVGSNDFFTLFGSGATNGANLATGIKVGAVPANGFFRDIRSRAYAENTGVNINTINNIYVGYRSVTDTSATTLSNHIGLYVDALAVSGQAAVINNYGLYLNTGETATNNYGVYQLGASVINYFSGKVGIGVTSPITKLDVAGDAKFSAHIDGTGSTLDVINTGVGRALSLTSVNTTNLVFNVTGPVSTNTTTGRAFGITATGKQ